MQINNNYQKLILSNSQDLPKTYFDLIEKVGSKGRYQFNMFLLFALIYFINGVTLLNTSFLFYAKQFQCNISGLLVKDCQNYVCALSSKQRQTYLIQQQDDIFSVVTQFGPFKCQESVFANLASSSVYFGALCGLIVFSSVSDNWGRKPAITLTVATTALGSVLVSCSTNIYMLVIGLIMSGGGISSAASIAYLFYDLFYGEVVQNEARQNLAYTVGSVCVTLMYYLFRHWRIISILTTAIPSLVALFFVIMYIEQTPQFLLDKNVKKALQSLNRIGKINFKLIDIISEKDIDNVKKHQNVQKQSDKNGLKIVPLDLLRFGSLRTTTLCICILNFLIYQMYYGPSLIIDKIGFNIFVTSFALQVSQLLIYIPTYPYVQKTKRKKAGVVVYFVAIICSGILVFVQKPQDCVICFQSVLELFIVLIFRSAISFYFMILLIYNVELYPSSSWNRSRNCFSCRDSWFNNMSINTRSFVKNEHQLYDVIFNLWNNWSWNGNYFKIDSRNANCRSDIIDLKDKIKTTKLIKRNNIVIKK